MPIFELVEGKFGEPKGDEDLMASCERFSKTEKCVRGVAKDCLTGLHKSASSAVSRVLIQDNVGSLTLTLIILIGTLIKTGCIGYQTI